MTMYEEIQQIIQLYPEMDEKLYHNSELFFQDWLETINLDSKTLFHICDGSYLLDLENDMVTVSFENPSLLIIDFHIKKMHVSSELSRASYIIGILRDRIANDTERNCLKVAAIYDELYDKFLELANRKEGSCAN